MNIEIVKAIGLVFVILLPLIMLIGYCIYEDSDYYQRKVNDRIHKELMDMMRPRFESLVAEAKDIAEKRKNYNVLPFKRRK